MGQYQPRFVEADRPELSGTIVRTPSGEEFDVVDQVLAAELGHGARVIKQSRGVFDELPLSLITTQTVAALGSMVDANLDVRRFRPNLVVEATGDTPFKEDEWIGSAVRVGGVTLRMDKRDKRCVMVNVDPVTSMRDPAILRAIARERQACLGVYGSTVEPGRVAVGDPVSIDR